LKNRNCQKRHGNQHQQKVDDAHECQGSPVVQVLVLACAEEPSCEPAETGCARLAVVATAAPEPSENEEQCGCREEQEQPIASWSTNAKENEARRTQLRTAKLPKRTSLRLKSNFMALKPFSLVKRV
jgi:hypothetical protein